jgi:hypothetical protein
MRSSCVILLIFISLFLSYNPLRAQNKSPLSLYPIIWKWLEGRADSAYTFTEQTHPTLISHLNDAFQVRRAREFWYQKNMDSFNSGRFNWLPVNGFLGRFQTLRGISRAGVDMVEQTLGGFTVHMAPVGHDSLKFIVFDIKSRWSLFFHLPFIHNIEYDHSRTRQKPMTNTYWSFEWTEPIKTGLFYQRQWNLLKFPHRNYSGHNF